MSAKTGKTRKTVAWVLSIAQLVISAVLVGVILKSGMLPYKYINLIVAGLAALLALTMCLACYRKMAIPSAILSVLFCAILLTGNIFLTKTIRTINEIGKNDEAVEFSVLSMQTSSLQAGDPLATRKVGYISSADEEFTALMLEKAAKDLEGAELIDIPAVGLAVSELYTGEIEALIFPESFRELIEEQFGAFNLETRILKTYQYTQNDLPKEESKPEESKSGEESKPEESKPDYSEFISEDIVVPTEPFAVYLSGSDYRGTLKLATLSDVNIIAVINPVSKVILLVSTPRDYYVRLPWVSATETRPYVYDKLTHAGVYGINRSMETLGYLYGIKVNHYIKIGFEGFMQAVDALGGLDVYSEIEFNTIKDPDRTNTSYHFVAGINHLEGEQALAFVRERHAFDYDLGGDRQRGRNQMAVIRAAMDKVTSPEILTKYSSLLDVVGNNVLYDFTQDEIAGLVKMQLTDMARWKIYSYSVSGSGALDYTFTYPTLELYVMRQNATMVANAKHYIEQVMNGEIPDVQ